MPKKARRPQRQAVHDRKVSNDLRTEHQKAVKVQYTAAYRRRLVLKAAGWALMAVGVIMALAHMVEHLGRLQLMSEGLQDLLIGYPMAGLLFVAGLVMIGRR